MSAVLIGLGKIFVCRQPLPGLLLLTLFLGQHHELEITVVDSFVILCLEGNIQTLLQIATRQLQITELVAVLRHIGQQPAQQLGTAQGLQAFARTGSRR